MASPTGLQQLHFVLIPLMCPGHLIPMVDMARLLVEHGVMVTLITTPLNAIRFEAIINRDIQSGLPIRILKLRFPCVEAGLPEGCENMDALPSPKLSKNFFDAARVLQQPIEKFLEETSPAPNCIISDRYLPWTIYTASKIGIPRLAFDGTSCFAFMCSYNIKSSRIHEKVSDSEYFVVPGLPDRIEVTKAQLPGTLNAGSVTFKDMLDEIKAADEASYGLVFNSFQELEERYVEECRKVKGDKVWCVGPVSLCNKDNIDKGQRGNKTSIDEKECLKWLNSWPSKSVVYACLGTLGCMSPLQLIELGLALEASKRPFIWVIRDGVNSNEFEKLFYEEGLERRTKDIGLIIRGWAPQVLILSHPAIGGFLTHCGWNSILEGVSAGLPMMTWPLLAEQFFNEQFVLRILRIGEKVGASIVMNRGEEKQCGVMVKREGIRKAIQMVMDEEEGKEKKKRAKELGEMANKALEGGESSYRNIKLLIEDILNQSKSKKKGGQRVTHEEGFNKASGITSSLSFMKFTLRLF
ncbi:UDP-glycosyltransferase 73C1-like [Pistacia vera]|uniref:UDP-glycosyltransferase 73C1-like n=1 Tax=Pistacia vera TaxID=55513 RepID=UPI0012634824|nr:UDP-glycosyltransferase 73C1-like [Pistacia vera]